MIYHSDYEEMKKNNNELTYFPTDNSPNETMVIVSQNNIYMLDITNYSCIEKKERVFEF